MAAYSFFQKYSRLPCLALRRVSDSSVFLVPDGLDQKVQELSVKSCQVSKSLGQKTLRVDHREAK